MTDDGQAYEVIIALATGFDATTGGLAKMGIQDVNGMQLSERWRDGVLIFQGLMVPGFPNMFLPYSVHAPTPFSNGPVGIEFQADFIRDIVKKMEDEKIKAIDPSLEVAQAWKAEIEFIANLTLCFRRRSRGIWVLISRGKRWSCFIILVGYIDIGRSVRKHLISSRRLLLYVRPR
jgi:hypothetical protein